MLVEDDGVWWVLIFMVVMVLSDIGGYVFGVVVGCYLMVFLVSLKKFWEGFVGLVIVCVVVGILFMLLVLDVLWWSGLLLGFFVVLLVMLGDFVELMIKCDLGIKDMGLVLFGYGGVMDWLDFLLVSVLVVWFLLYLLV